MIKYNLNNIDDWYFNSADIIKVYRNNAVCYYKITSGETPTQVPCFAVVDDITQYSDTEFEDVYDKATEKWYKLNNLNQYEEYGVYGDSIATSGSSRLPQGYTEVEYVENTGTSYFNTNFVPNQDTRIVCDMQMVTLTDFPRLWGAGAWNSATGIMPNYEGGYLNMSWLGKTSWTQYTSVPTSFDRRVIDVNKNYLYVDNVEIGSNTYTTRTASDHLGVFTYIASGRPGSSTYWGREHFKGKMYSFQVYDNGTLVRDLVPCIRDNDSTVGAYDVVNDVFYTVPTGYTTDQLVAGPSVVNTYYQGKLAIVDGYEYMYSGSSWVNVGEVSGSTIQTVWYDPASTNASFSIGHYWGEGYKMVLNVYLSGSYGSNSSSFWTQTNQEPIEFIFYQNGFFYDFHNPTSTTSPDVNTGDYNWRIMKNNTLGSYENSQILNIILSNGAVRVELEETGAAIVTGSTSVTAQNWYNGLYLPKIENANSNNKCHLSRIQVYNANNELVNDLKFVKNAGVTGSQEISLYDSVLGVTYNNANSNTPSYHIVSESGGTEYPIYYDEIQDPPNNLTFNTMAEAEEYDCPWVGMRATIDGDNYIFSGDSQSGYEWIEQEQHNLPDIPFSLNYNAKQYDSTNRKMPQTSGQLQNVDAVCNYGYNIVDHSADGYISITGNSRFICSGNSGTYLNRTNTQTGCTMTIVSKAKTTSGYSILTNRQGNGTTYLNWMYRQYADGYMKLHGQVADLQIACSTTEPNILVARTYYDNGVKYYLNNWSSGTTSSTATFAYLNTATSGGALFCDYSDVNNEFWQGDFYWIYMTHEVLTDEQIQQVIDYNENL